MNRIKILPKEIYTRIAAGEVIERPSNIVKELIENSIDASATEIIIEIVSGGRKLIRVTDNGIGMSKEDLELSIQPHATSKIEKFEDIYNLSTLGFRGEALSSIVNVSKTTITTKSKEQPFAYQMIVHGGEKISLKESSRITGTTVEVRDLFYNVPARLKFLKTDYTEKIHIIHTVEEYAIAYPEISFKLYSDNNLILSVSQTNNLLERIKEILKKEVVENFIKFEYEDKIIKILCFITPIEYSHINKSLQMFYINKRPVSVRVLSQALYDAYKDILSTGRHPVGIIFLDIPAERIDINVHPTKRIVKLKDEELIYNIIKNNLRQKINKYYSKVSQNFQKEENINRSEVNQSTIVSEPNYTYSLHTPQNSIFVNKIENIGFEFKLQDNITDSDAQFAKLGLKNYTYLGQLHRTYLLFETLEGLTLIDQHAASERIFYEKFLFSNNTTIQKLLFPINLELKQSDFEAIKQYIETINKLGFEVIITGKTSIGFYSIPSLFSKKEIKDFIYSFIENLLDDVRNQTDNITSKEKIARSACRAAIKANDLMSLSEVHQLIKDLANCKTPFVCPHGRPTILTIDISKIEKLFQRRK